MLQNNYKAIIDYNVYESKQTYVGVVVIGRAGTFSEAVRRIEEKFAPNPNDKCTIQSMECLGWETF